MPEVYDDAADDRHAALREQFLLQPDQLRLQVDRANGRDGHD
jgi:hypothetical protein